LLEQLLTETLSLALIPIGVVAVGLIAISVQLYFQTNSFVEEYSDKIAALTAKANGEISAQIEEITQLSTGGSKQARLGTVGTVLPVPVADLTEQLL
jgi:hypothetical protein